MGHNSYLEHEYKVSQQNLTMVSFFCGQTTNGLADALAILGGPLTFTHCLQNISPLSYSFLPPAGFGGHAATSAPQGDSHQPWWLSFILCYNSWGLLCFFFFGQRGLLCLNPFFSVRKFVCLYADVAFLMFCLYKIFHNQGKEKEKVRTPLELKDQNSRVKPIYWESQPFEVNTLREYSNFYRNRS